MIQALTRALILAFALLALLSEGVAQPASQSHPGMVHVGKGKWVVPAQAESKGYIFYRDRWVPKKLAKKLRKWEKLDKKTKSWKDAYKVKSKHYRIKTNAPRYIVELELKSFLDALYKTYVTVFKNDFGLSGKAANSNFIEIYWGLATWKANEDSDRGTPGYFEDGGVLKVLYDPCDTDDFYNTVFHEGAHQFFAATLPGATMPVWLDEALATYFEGCTFSRSSLKITANHVPANRADTAQTLIRRAKAAGKPLTPDAMFMSIADSDKFEAEHYALAWSFLYYLMHRDQGKHRKDLRKFLNEINGSGTKSVDRVFKEATKKDFAKVKAGWAEFVLKAKFPPEYSYQVLLPSEASDDEDVQKDDLLVSIDGVMIETDADFERHWVRRDESKALRLKVLREYNKRGPMDYDLKYVFVTVKAGSKLVLNADDVIAFVRNVTQ